MAYTGRFAPSPTGPLHAGSLLAALASWLDARVHGGRWLVRIEDVDSQRCVPGIDTHILSQLAACGLLPDETPIWQSRRSTLYEDALAQLIESGKAYPCACTRADIQRALATTGQSHSRHAESIYPGTCRPEHGGADSRVAYSTRLHVGEHRIIAWTDRRLGPQQQNLASEVGDFVLRRADACWAYQLAVVVDDADQGITHIVRGEDLANNTARQIYLQGLLDVSTPTYFHTWLVLGKDSEKLSKSNVAREIETGVKAIKAALLTLELHAGASTVDGLLASAVAQWRERWGSP